MGGFSGGGSSDTADFGNTTPTKKDKKKSANVEQGLGSDRMYRYSVSEGGLRKDNDNSKSKEQPKVASQMNAPKTTTVAGPTDVEMDQDLISLENKKRGRRRTLLSGVGGDTSTPTLSMKTLLG